jgi:hypothetical protein
MKSIFGFIAALAVLIGTPAAAAPLTAEQVRADLIFFRDQWAPREHAYTDESRARMRAFIDSRIAAAQPMERAELALTMSRAMALTGNNHTKTRYFQEEGSFSVVPISFWWFPEGAMVTRAHPGQQDLLGARILAIGGVPVEQARERDAAYIPGTADRVLYDSPNWLRRLEVLRVLGLSDGTGASFTFRLADGRRVVRRLTAPPAPTEAGRYPDPAQYSDSWRASMVPGRGPDPWPHILERLPQLPLYAQAPATFATAELEDGRVLYLRSTGIFPIGEDTPMDNRVFSLLAATVADGDPPNHVVVDLRFNEGGDFMTITNLVTALVRMTAPDGRIYVITGRGTNSAAIAFAAMLKGQAPERTRFVGEHPSDNAAFWAEGADLTTPSGIVLHYTDGFHDWGRGCRDLRRCFWPVVFYGTAIGDLDPDIPVAMGWNDFVAGRDPALEAALADLRRVAGR